MTQSLHGLRILNTRPKDQARRFSHSIEAAGGSVIECPALEITATDGQWTQLLPALHTVQKAIFISANAVHFCFKQLGEKKIEWPQTIEVIAIGRASAAALEHNGICVHAIPEVPDSEHLLKLNSLHHIENQNLLLFKGCGGRPLIEEHLVQQNAKLTTLDVYKRELPKIDPQFIDSIWRNDLVDIILITSVESAHNLFKIFGEEAQTWLQSKPCLVISERLAKAVTLLGMQQIIISHPDRIVETLFDFNS